MSAGTTKITKGMEVGEGEAVGLAVEVGISATRVELPGSAQEASRIKGRMRIASFCCTGKSPGKGCRYFT
jgi:hypothetical protein